MSSRQFDTPTEIIRKWRVVLAVAGTIAALCFWMTRPHITCAPCYRNASVVNSEQLLQLRDDEQPLQRPINRVLADFRPDLAERIRKLEAMNAPADSPEVVQLARDVIDRIPASAGKFPIKLSLSIDKTPQANTVDELTFGLRGGFFVECGAFDGERSSNTNWLEKHRGWTGLLLEMEPFYYTQLLGRNRRVWSANVCLSPLKKITTLPYTESFGQISRLNYGPTQHTNHTKQTEKNHSSFVPCFPLESLLLAINRTRVDYFSLDIEGLELEVLETIPWSKLDIRIMSVEDKHVRRGSKAVVDYVTGNGYQLVKKINAANREKAIYVQDLIFARRQLTYRSPVRKLTRAAYT